MVVLIGDEKQLGPIVISREAEVAGFDISLFERFCYYYEGSNFITTLKEQYRMHEFLYRFSNDKFYNNQMISRTKNILDENVMNNFPWPDKTIPSFSQPPYLLYSHCSSEDSFTLRVPYPKCNPILYYHILFFFAMRLSIVAKDNASKTFS